MQGLLKLLLQNGGIISFILMEALCFFIIIHFNTKQAAVWDNTFGILAGNALEQRRKMTRFTHLPEVVDSLMAENAALKSELISRQMVRVHLLDTAYQVRYDSVKGTIRTAQYTVIPCDVIGNSVHLENNWVMLNKGKADGVEPHSGVISKSGIVGVVRHVGNDFSLAMSVLHQQVRVSAILRGHLGSLLWTGGDPTVMQLNDIPKDIEPQIGDTILTSGYSLMFPKNQLIGTVVGIDLPKGSNFYAIKVKLSQSPGASDQVYVVRSLLKSSVDSLQQKISHE
jgi:rod shape-determining protein MreC